MRFVAAGGVTLVDGDRAASMRVSPDTANGGHVRVEVVDGAHVDDITTRIDGGRIAGELQVRDGTLARAAADLDQLAYDFSTQVNGVHAANAGLDGASGRNLFVDNGAAAGAAAAMAVDPAIDADPRLLAGAAAGASSGDNTGFLALGALADQPLAGAGSRSFTAEGIRLIGQVGTEARQAVADRDLELARADVLASARDSLSGVSTEEEAQRLNQFQRGAEAASNFLSTVDQLLGDLIERL
jgi:flagellar hook-associated protein 1 FlgK